MLLCEAFAEGLDEGEEQGCACDCYGVLWRADVAFARTVPHCWQWCGGQTHGFGVISQFRRVIVDKYQMFAEYAASMRSICVLFAASKSAPRLPSVPVDTS